MNRRRRPGDNLPNAEAGAATVLQERYTGASGIKVTPKSRLHLAKSGGYNGASSKIKWQAGMSRLISDVRSYVRLHATEVSAVENSRTTKPQKSEEHPLQAGMCKGMSGLAGYVNHRRIENRDFRENLHRTGR